MRRATFILTFSALLACAAMVEVFLRVTGRFAPPPEPGCRMHPQWCDLFEPSDAVGYLLRPSRKSVVVFPNPKDNPGQTEIISNRDGFRGMRELDEVEGRRRIIVLGDSMVFGAGVAEKDRFTDVLESLEPSWRVDNLAMPGWGPDLMLRALEHVGLDSFPDIVIFSIYTDDFRRVQPYYIGVGFPTVRYVVRSGELLTVRYPGLWFWERMRIVQALRQSYWQYSESEWKLNQAILDRFRWLASRHKFRPVVVFLPGTGDTLTDKARRRWLEKYTHGNNTPFLDLSGSIHRYQRDEVFIRDDFHFNAAGHRIVAEHLHRFLATEVLHRP